MICFIYIKIWIFLFRLIQPKLNFMKQKTKQKSEKRGGDRKKEDYHIINRIVLTSKST